MPSDVVGALMFLEDYVKYTKLSRKVGHITYDSSIGGVKSNCDAVNMCLMIFKVTGVVAGKDVSFIYDYSHYVILHV